MVFALLTIHLSTTFPEESVLRRTKREKEATCDVATFAKRLCSEIQESFGFVLKIMSL